MLHQWLSQNCLCDGDLVLCVIHPNKLHNICILLLQLILQHMCYICDGELVVSVRCEVAQRPRSSDLSLGAPRVQQLQQRLHRPRTSDGDLLVVSVPSKVAQRPRCLGLTLGVPSEQQLQQRLHRPRTSNGDLVVSVHCKAAQHRCCLDLLLRSPGLQQLYKRLHCPRIYKCFAVSIALDSGQSDILLVLTPVLRCRVDQSVQAHHHDHAVAQPIGGWDPTPPSYH
eukprot:1194378-Prorocentrum_minimum.AAC.2